MCERPTSDHTSALPLIVLAALAAAHPGQHPQADALGMARVMPGHRLSPCGRGRCGGFNSCARQHEACNNGRNLREVDLGVPFHHRDCGRRRSLHDRARGGEGLESLLAGRDSSAGAWQLRFAFCTGACLRARPSKAGVRRRAAFSRCTTTWPTQSFCFYSPRLGFRRQRTVQMLRQYGWLTVQTARSAGDCATPPPSSRNLKRQPLPLRPRHEHLSIKNENNDAINSSRSGPPSAGLGLASPAFAQSEIIVAVAGPMTGKEATFGAQFLAGAERGSRRHQRQRAAFSASN